MAKVDFDMREFEDLSKAAAKAKAVEWREKAREELRLSGKRLGWNVGPVVEGISEVHWDSSVGGYVFEARHSASGFMEYGTAPHTIVPVRADALHFFVDTGLAAFVGPARTDEVPGGKKEIFTKHVDHPGTPPLMFVRKSKERIIATQADLEGSGLDPEDFVGQPGVDL